MSPRGIRPHERILVYDRAPFNITVGDTLYPACSQDCARNIYLVKGLGEAFKVVSEFKRNA